MLSEIRREMAVFYLVFFFNSVSSRHKEMVNQSLCLLIKRSQQHSFD